MPGHRAAARAGNGLLALASYRARIVHRLPLSGPNAASAAHQQVPAISILLRVGGSLPDVFGMSRLGFLIPSMMRTIEARSPWQNTRRELSLD